MPFEPADLSMHDVPNDTGDPVQSVHGIEYGDAPTPILALFDFDGTLTKRELYAEFVRGAVPPLRLMMGRLALAPLVLGYRLGWVSGTRIRASIVRVAFTGASRARVESAGAHFAQHCIPPTLRPEMMQRIEWHRARGDTVVVVSAALGVYLRPWCESQGLMLLCSELETRGERLTGRYAGAQCVGPHKATRVIEQFDLSRFAEIHAWGDTPEDRELLALAHRRWYRSVECSSAG